MQPALNPAFSSRLTGWVFGPVFDSLFIANVFWPLLLFFQHDDGFEGRSAVQFWQVYFITTPHRWITIVLVLLERRRFRQQCTVFVGLAAIVVLACVGIRIVTGALTCLLAIDYVWNAWHFAAQHHGIYRIYTRLSPGIAASAIAIQIQKWMLRFFLLYVTLRIASSTFADVVAEHWTSTADWCVLVLPALLLIGEFRTPSSGSFGRRLYLVSLLGIYLGLILCGAVWQCFIRRVDASSLSTRFHPYEDVQQTTKAHEHAAHAAELSPSQYRDKAVALIKQMRQLHFGCFRLD